MRFSSICLALCGSALLASSLKAQTISPVPTSGTSQITVSGGTAGENVSFFTANEAKPNVCDATTPPLHLIAGTTPAILNQPTTTFVVQETLFSGQVVCGTETAKDTTKNLAAVTVAAPATAGYDWGLIRAYFTGGLLISNDNSGFSSAHEFLSLIVDKAWLLPGCYLVAPVEDPLDLDSRRCAPRRLGPFAKVQRPVAVASGGKSIPLEVASATVSDDKGLSVLTAGAASANANGVLTLTNAVVRVISGLTLNLGSGANQLQLSGKDVLYIENGQFSGTTAGTDSGMLTLKQGSLNITRGYYVAAANANTLANFEPFVRTASPGWWGRHHPGINTSFEARLTAIPVSANALNTSQSNIVCPPANSSATTPTNCTSFNNSQKTARVAVAVYTPVLFTRWQYGGNANALFIAPLFKVGFDTLTAPSDQTVLVPGTATTATATFEHVYNHGVVGARIGHMQLANSRTVAPEIYSYLDITLGRFSNLESLICGVTIVNNQTNQPVAGKPAPTNFPNSQCAAQFPQLYSNSPTGFTNKPYETRKRIPRLDFEGLLKIPSTIFYVGFNANIGQEGPGANFVDLAFRASDDVRFFFGTKFDLATALSKLGGKK